jgi:hypothetical protein
MPARTLSLFLRALDPKFPDGESRNPQLINMTTAKPCPADAKPPDSQSTYGQRSHRDCAERQRTYRYRTEGHRPFASHRWRSAHRRGRKLSSFLCLAPSVIAHVCLLSIETGGRYRSFFGNRLQPTI